MRHLCALGRLHQARSQQVARGARLVQRAVLHPVPRNFAELAQIVHWRLAPWPSRHPKSGTRSQARSMRHCTRKHPRARDTGEPERHPRSGAELRPTTRHISNAHTALTKSSRPGKVRLRLRPRLRLRRRLRLCPRQLTCTISARPIPHTSGKGPATSTVTPHGTSRHALDAWQRGRRLTATNSENPSSVLRCKRPRLQRVRLLADDSHAAVRLMLLELRIAMRMRVS